MNNLMNEKAIRALKELREAMYDSVPEEKKKFIDEREVEEGAKNVSKMFSKMHPFAACCIMKSFLDNDPKIVQDIAKFADFIESAYDIFGVHKTAEMIAKGMVGIKDDLIKRVDEEFKAEKKLKEMNGEPKEKEEVQEDLRAFKEFLKSRGWELEVEKVEEEDDD